MRRKNKRIMKNKYTITLIFLLLLVVSMGFAYIVDNLDILGSSLLKGNKWNVHWENVQVSDKSVKMEKPKIIDNGTTVEYEVVLDKPGDIVEFTVDAKNDGTIDAMIESIDQMKLYENGSSEPLESIPEYLDCSITYDGNEGVAIAKNHLLKQNKKATYKIHVEYKRDIPEEQIVSEQKSFVMSFGVTYKQADNKAISPVAE